MRTRNWVVLLAGACLVTGCLVQSLEPFVNGSQQIQVPGIEGDWKLVHDFGNELTPDDPTPPWTFTLQDPNNTNRVSYQIRCVQTVDKQPFTTETGTLRTVFFKVGNHTYCDVMAPIPAKITRYQSASLERVHTLGRVELSNDLLCIRMPNMGWFGVAATNGVFTMPHIWRFRKSFLVTDQKPDWKTFLETHGNDSRLFSTNLYFTFRRAATGNSVPGKP